MKVISFIKENMVALIRVAIYAILLTALYYSTFSWMIYRWYSSPDYNYCFLIPLLVVYLIWEKRKELSYTPSYPSSYGFLPLICGIILFSLGELAGEYYTLYISFWLVIISLIWIHLGWKKMKIISFALIMILTMFPIPDFLYNNISIRLQLISSKLGVVMIQIFGIPVYREGNIIDLGFSKLQVVEACSGLRYVIPLMVLGLICTYFFEGKLWKKIFIFFSTIPIAIFANGFRIGITGILSEIYSPKVAESFFHGFSGWFIFMFGLGILLLEMRLLGKWKTNRVKGYKSKGHFFVRKKQKSWNYHFLGAVTLLGITLIIFQGVEFREKIPSLKPLSQFPLQIGQWKGTPKTMEQKFIDALDLSDYVIIDFLDKQKRLINFYVAYYESQRKGESIHSPATCLPGSGWFFREAGAIIIPVPAHGGSIRVNRALMEKIGQKQLCYYWFSQRGRVFTNAYQLKIFVFWDALTKHRTNVALVRVISPVYKGEDIKDVDKRLQDFIKEVFPILEEFIPGKKLNY